MSCGGGLHGPRAAARCSPLSDPADGTDGPSRVSERQPEPSGPALDGSRHLDAGAIIRIRPDDLDSARQPGPGQAGGRTRTGRMDDAIDAGPEQLDPRRHPRTVDRDRPVMAPPPPPAPGRLPATLRRNSESAELEAAIPSGTSPAGLQPSAPPQDPRTHQRCSALNGMTAVFRRCWPYHRCRGSWGTC